LKIESRVFVSLEYGKPEGLVDNIGENFLSLDQLVDQMISHVNQPHNSKFAQHSFNGNLIRVCQNSNAQLILRDYDRKCLGAFMEVIGPDCEENLSETDKEIDRLLAVVSKLKAKSYLEKNPQS
jgi:hypothetical protein